MSALKDPFVQAAGTDVPTPEEYEGHKAYVVAGVALLLKMQLIEALKAGKREVYATYSAVVLDLLRDEFAAAGWDIIDHGISIELRRRNESK